MGNSWGADVKSQQFLSTVAFDTILDINISCSIEVHSQPSYLWTLHLQNQPVSENMVYNNAIIILLSEAHLS